MKSIKELRNSTINFNVEHRASSIKYLKSCNIDFDVYLPTLGCNLQRDYVWNLFQKRELIWSIFIERNIPYMAMINLAVYENDHYQVIDGKQRLKTIFDFIDDKFTILIDNVEYLFSQLPDDYKSSILHYRIRYYIVNEMSEKITDKQKIQWFKFINFAGTPQDYQHLNKLNINA